MERERERERECESEKEGGKKEGRVRKSVEERLINSASPPVSAPT